MMSAGQLASGVVANVQLEQVRSLLAGLQMVIGATLAVSAASVGVSMAGFALVLKRLDQVRKDLAAVGKSVTKIDDMMKNVLTRIATRDWEMMNSLLHQANEAWHHSSPEGVWRPLLSLLDIEVHFCAALSMVLRERLSFRMRNSPSPRPSAPTRQCFLLPAPGIRFWCLWAKGPGPSRSRARRQRWPGHTPSPASRRWTLQLRSPGRWTRPEPS